MLGEYMQTKHNHTLHADTVDYFQKRRLMFHWGEPSIHYQYMDYVIRIISIKDVNGAILPSYVIMWIIDWICVPFYTYPAHKKIKIIDSIKKSYLKLNIR